MDLTAVAEFVAYLQVVDPVENSAACCSFPSYGYSFDNLSDGMELGYFVSCCNIMISSKLEMGCLLLITLLKLNVE